MLRGCSQDLTTGYWNFSAPSETLCQMHIDIQVPFQSDIMKMSAPCVSAYLFASGHSRK